MILAKSDKMPVHTDLRPIFDWLHGYHIKLNWMISDVDADSVPDVLEPARIGYVLLSGQELHDLVYRETILFRWGVFSGFRVACEAFDTSTVPRARGNDLILKTEEYIEHPDAECQITAWDSTYTLFFSRMQKAMWIFSMHFPEAIKVTEDEKP